MCVYLLYQYVHILYDYILYIVAILFFVCELTSIAAAMVDQRRFGRTTAPDRGQSAEHLQRILLVARKHLAFEHLKLLAIGTVLAFAPRRILAVLHAPMAGEDRRQHLELVAGQKHFVYLRTIEALC